MGLCGSADLVAPLEQGIDIKIQKQLKTEKIEYPA
jgi:hypothetical protein